MKVYGILRLYEPDNKKFPRNKTEFKEYEDDYRQIIDELIRDRFVDLGSGVDVETNEYCSFHLRAISLVS